MTAAELYKILAEVDRAIAKQDQLISMLEDEVRDLYDLYNRLRIKWAADWKLAWISYLAHQTKV
jgi:hypothetical protein